MSVEYGGMGGDNPQDDMPVHVQIRTNHGIKWIPQRMLGAGKARVGPIRQRHYPQEVGWGLEQTQAANAHLGGGTYSMYEGNDMWESGGVYSAQQPYATARVQAAAQQDRGGYGYGKGGYSGGNGKYQGGKGGYKGKGKGEGKGEGKGYGTPGPGAYGGCFR